MLLTSFYSPYKIIIFVPEEFKIMLSDALILSLINQMSSVRSTATLGNLRIIENIIGMRKYD